MVSKLRYAVVLTMGLLAGCAGQDIEAMRGVAPSGGTAFTQALAEEYRSLTVFEADEMFNWASAALFARKGLRAANGEVVQPEVLEDWRIPSDKIGEMSDARSRLVGLLDASARDKFPELAARAQGRFDCWIEQQEENHQPDHIAACRDQFYAALAELEAAMAPPAPAAVEPAEFVVFFAFDSDAVGGDGMDVLDLAVSTAGEMGIMEFAVTGHTDSTGSEAYNEALSFRRAEAVREGLVARGVGSDNISVGGRGEGDQAVATGDNVREAANRRVVILIQ